MLQYTCDSWQLPHRRWEVASRTIFQVSGTKHMFGYNSLAAVGSKAGKQWVRVKTCNGMNLGMNDEACNGMNEVLFNKG